MFENVLNPKTRSLIKTLKANNFPKNSCLGGGTAIALQLGHRLSADLDFFTSSQFNENQWEEKLKKELGFKLIQKDWQTLTGSAKGVKLSLFGYKYKLLQKPLKFYNTLIASLPDLATMKLETIISRGAKRDFLDIYFLAQKYSLEQLLNFHQKRHVNLSERRLLIKKGLVFFDEADKDEMPCMFVDTNWNKVKEWMVKEVRSLN